MFSAHYFGRSYFGPSYFGKGSAGGVLETLEAEHGQFALAGQSAGMVVSYLLIAGHGTFALGGQDAEMTVSEGGAGSFSTAASGSPYAMGDLVQIAGLFLSAEDVLTDPDTVLISVRKPDGATTNHTYPASVTRAGAGQFYINWSCEMAGRHLYRLESTGAVQAAFESEFYVTQSGFN